jgi:recombination protein RecT
MAKGQAIQQKQPPSPAELFRQKQRRFIDVVHSKRDQIAMALPQQMQSQQALDRFVRVCLTALNNTPKLFECTMTSVLAAMVKSAQLGLEPDGTLGQAYLVPYGNQCQFIPGYRGLITLAQRTNRIQRVYAHVVFEADEFDFELGLEEKLIHKPAMARYSHQGYQNARAVQALGDDHPAELTPVCAYGVIAYKDSSRRFEVVPSDRMEKIKQASRGSGHPDSPWQKWTEEMWRKTAIKQVLRFEPLSPDDQAASALAEASRLDGALFGEQSMADDGKLVPDVGGEPAAAAAWPAAEPNGAAPSAMDQYVAGQGSAPAQSDPEPEKPKRRRRSKPKSKAGEESAEAPPAASSAPDPEADTKRAPEADQTKGDGAPASTADQSQEQTESGTGDAAPPVTRPKRQGDLPNVQ